MPDSRPDTLFKEGVCSACLAYDRRKFIDWEERKNALIQLLETRTARNSNREFDCIVPSSGGKDSHFQVLTLLELGARPLVVTATTCHLTPIGRRNIDNLSQYATTLEITPNKTVRAKLNNIGLEIVGDISWPEHVLIHTLPFTIAKRMGINLVFYGENPLNAYGGPSEVHQKGETMTRRWASEFGGFLGLRPSDLVGLEGLTERDMSDYIVAEEVDSVDVRFLGQYVPWNSHENANKAKDAGMEHKLPCTANYWRHENLDNAQTGLHDYMMWLKYGYGRGCAQVSADLRSGHWIAGRDKALEFVESIDGKFPETYCGISIDEILERIGMTRLRLQEIMEQFTNDTN